MNSEMHRQENPLAEQTGSILEIASGTALRTAQDTLETSSERGHALAVFDIGGTWFRSGLWCESASDGELLEDRREPAVNFLSRPDLTAAQLQEEFVLYLLREAKYLAERAQRRGVQLDEASISLGAAVNAYTGEVLNSGPLWGPGCCSFHLEHQLRERSPSMRWHVTNDVTAAVLRYVNDNECADKKVLFITVSTGIGARLFNKGTIPLDEEVGIQGEIGHLPVTFRFRGKFFSALCDCGGENHLNAFASGRGLERWLAQLPDLSHSTPGLAEDLSKSMLRPLLEIRRTSAAAGEPEPAPTAIFTHALQQRDPLALEVLDALTRPLAEMLAVILTYDPELQEIVLTGGVVNAFPDSYVESLNRTFCQNGLFQILERQPDVFTRRCRVATSDDRGGLIGAAYFARSLSRLGGGVRSE